MTPEKAKELVLCIPKPSLQFLGDLNGAVVAPCAIADISERSGTYLPRGVCEENPFFKQPIVQIMLVCKNRIAIHVVPTTGGDPRFHNQTTLFFGGHMNPEDRGGVWDAARRETVEETGLQPEAFELEWLGYVNLNNQLQSAVHFGVIFAAHIEDEIVFEAVLKRKAKDEGVSKLRLVEWKEVLEHYEGLNAWAKCSYPVLRDHFENRKPFVFTEPTAPLLFPDEG